MIVIYFLILSIRFDFQHYLFTFITSPLILSILSSYVTIISSSATMIKLTASAKLILIAQEGGGAYQ